MKLEKVVLGKNGISKINISHEDGSYEVKINNEALKISGSGFHKEGGEYNRIEDETTWYLRHCCGASGFGMGIDDSCASCDNNGYTTNEEIGKWNGDRNLKEVISYSLKIESEINDVFKINDLFKSQK